MLKSVAFVCKMISKNHRNARSIYIASQKATFTAFIAIIKKVEHTLEEEIILKEEARQLKVPWDIMS